MFDVSFIVVNVQWSMLNFQCVILIFDDVQLSMSTMMSETVHLK